YKIDILPSPLAKAAKTWANVPASFPSIQSPKEIDSIAQARLRCFIFCQWEALIAWPQCGRLLLPSCSILTIHSRSNHLSGIKLRITFTWASLEVLNTLFT
ncbi:unnamed protein product, partial [Dovyalis caffra]